MSPAARARVVAMLPEGDSSSEWLRLDHGAGGSEWRILADKAPIEIADEQIAHLRSMIDHMLAREEEALLRADELDGKLVEERRLREAEQRLREEAERRLAEALAEIERLERR